MTKTPKPAEDLRREAADAILRRIRDGAGEMKADEVKRLTEAWAMLDAGGLKLEDILADDVRDVIE